MVTGDTPFPYRRREGALGRSGAEWAPCYRGPLMSLPRRCNSRRRMGGQFILKYNYRRKRKRRLVLRFICFPLYSPGKKVTCSTYLLRRSRAAVVAASGLRPLVFVHKFLARYLARIWESLRDVSWLLEKTFCGMLSAQYFLVTIVKCRRGWNTRPAYLLFTKLFSLVFSFHVFSLKLIC